MLKKILLGSIVMLLVLSAFVYTKISFFSVQPIGALPEVATFVMWRKGNMGGFESADGMCVKATGGVSLLCRSMMIGKVMEKDSIIFKMPYMKTLYLKSTNGQEFDR